MDIADEFYKITNTAINKDKSELIIHRKLIPKSVDLKFRNENIIISPATEPVRFLEVWLTFSKKKSFVNQQLKNEIIRFCNIIKRKLLTDIQMSYVFNMVLAPFLIYRLQIYIL